jgi:hypothetical protein
MPTKPIGLRVLADFASDAVHFELLEPAKVIAWADSMIGAADVPPPWMIDLSLADQSDPLAVRAALREVPGEPDPDQSTRLLNALVLREWQRGRLTIGRVRGIGWRLYSSELERRDLSRWGVVVECEGESLDDGSISESTLRGIIDRELVPFEADVRQLPPWA